MALHACSGLANARAAELVEFDNGTLGIVFNLEADNVGVIIMGESTGIAEGQTVRSTGRIVSVPVGEGMIGRVINAVGQPVDGKGPIKSDKFRPIERIAPNVVSRKSVDTPVQTGIKAIDAMIPIGRGQRELIIGDRQTGKTALAIDTIINQKGQNLICIYVAIGQRQAQVAQVIATLEKHGAHGAHGRGRGHCVGAGRAAIHRALCGLRHRRGVHGAGQGRAHHLR